MTSAADRLRTLAVGLAVMVVFFSPLWGGALVAVAFGYSAGSGVLAGVFVYAAAVVGWCAYSVGEEVLDR